MKLHAALQGRGGEPPPTSARAVTAAAVVARPHQQEEHDMSVRVRPATPGDHAFLVGIVPRLRAFGPSPLRPAEALDRAERATLERALSSPTPDETLLVAELDGVGAAGVAYAHEATDYFTGERHGHLGILVVAEAGEGQGVGRALLAAVEAWSTARGYRFVTLNVFADNARARAVYERAGYAPDTLRYVKELPRGAPPREGGAGERA